MDFKCGFPPRSLMSVMTYFSGRPLGSLIITKTVANVAAKDRN
jgi:hypothetical protein